MTALRENVHLKLDRLEHVGSGAIAAADRRQLALGGAASVARRSVCSFWQGPRLLGRGLGDV